MTVTFGTAVASAQEYVPTPVTVSKEKVKLNGKTYLSHVVLERQTLYGISRAYGVSEEDLYRANPSLRETGLQKNAILLIPVADNAASDSKDEPQVQTQTKGYTEHTVKWYEDIDDIAEKYNVSVKEIMEMNGLDSRKLKTRQILRIPVKGVVPAEGDEVRAAADSLATDLTPGLEDDDAEEDAEENEVETFVIPDKPIVSVTDKELLRLRVKDQVDFSLILPLKAGSSSSDANMDFYSGVLMALRDLEKEGLKVNMHVYDLAAGMPSTEALCRSDFVLGPVASRDIEAVLQRVEGRVPVISPLDQKAASLAANYDNFIQAPAAADYQYEDLAAWLQQDLEETDRVIFITEKGAGNTTASVAIRSALAKRGIEYQILSYAIVEGRSIPNTLSGYMSKSATNRVVVASESEAFMGDAVRNLGIMLGKGYEVVMYAPSKVRTFDTIEGSSYHDASLHISTAYHVDYADPAVNTFVRSYRALFRTEPTQFAFQGYDTARFFVLRSARYGGNWPRLMGRERSSGLHTDFLFEPSMNGNSANQAVRRIVFQKDYSTTIER